MPEPPSEFSHAVALHLAARGWSTRKCCHCGLPFFGSPPRNSCLRADCSDEVPLSGVAASLRPRFPEEVWHAARLHFVGAQFATTNRVDIANPPHRATRFVGAGLQVFEDGLERREAPPTMPLFVPQPVIRLNYWATVGVRNATSTSFVNLCTEHAQSSLTEFLRHLDLWMGLLRDLRIRPADVTIRLGSERWRGGPFAGPCLSIEVNGTEVGDAILIDEGGIEATGHLPIADFSFGLERIVAAVNPGVPYSFFLGALPESALPENERAIDRLRTATLICMSGVDPSSRGHGRHLRRAVTDAQQQGPALGFAAAIAHAHDYWSQFITPVRGRDECQRLLEAEWARARAIEVVRVCRPGAPNPDLSAASADEACRRLLAGGGDTGLIARCATVLRHKLQTPSPPLRGSDGRSESDDGADHPVPANDGTPRGRGA